MPRKRSWCSNAMEKRASDEDDDKVVYWQLPGEPDGRKEKHRKSGKRRNGYTRNAYGRGRMDCGSEKESRRGHGYATRKDDGSMDP